MTPPPDSRSQRFCQELDEAAAVERERQLQAPAVRPELERQVVLPAAPGAVDLFDGRAVLIHAPDEGDPQPQRRRLQAQEDSYAMVVHRCEVADVWHFT